MSARACPVCGGEAAGLAFPYETNWSGTIYRYHRCAGCSATFVDPVPDERRLNEIYAWENYHRNHYPEIETAGFNHSLSLLRQHCPGPKTLLDFGCGNGGYLIAAGEAGFDCYGVEYEQSTIRMAEETAGVPVYSLKDLRKTQRRFDIIHLSDVLPHLIDPVVEMRLLEEFLAPDGVFCIEGPLENNPSLVYFVARLVKSIRRTLWLDRISHGPPTMLIRLNQRTQKWFFSERMNYNTIVFELFETGWPYFARGQPSRSVGNRLKQAVGYIAITLSRIQPRRRKFLGNRFFGVFTPCRSDI